MKKLFKQKSETIQVYIGRETEDDPYEKTTTVVMDNPIMIKALVNDIPSEKIIWRLPNIKTEKAKELIIEQRNIEVIRLSQKITIDSEDYYGYRDNTGKLLLTEVDGEYFILKVYIRI